MLDTYNIKAFVFMIYFSCLHVFFTVNAGAPFDTAFKMEIDLVVVMHHTFFNGLYKNIISKTIVIAKVTQTLNELF
jgi:hypothetical protein